MAKFCTDVDLLKWEPVLFRELALPSQTLCGSDDGVVLGTTLTSAEASFNNAGVEAGNVIHLYNGESEIDGCYEVVAVDSATSLTVSVVRANDNATPIAPPAGTDVRYRISTFGPQAEEAAYGLLQYFGIDASESDNVVDVNDIVDQTVLRQASVFAVLAAVFASSAASINDNANLWQKSLRYQKLFQEARVKVRIGIDHDDSGTAEQFRIGGTVRLRRG